MDQTDRHERHARRSCAAPRMSTLFLSCALLLTTSILARHYGHSTPLWRGSASVRWLPLPPTCSRMSAFGCLATPRARPTVVFVRGITIVDYQTPPRSGVADGVLLERPACGSGSSHGSTAIGADL